MKVDSSIIKKENAAALLEITVDEESLKEEFKNVISLLHKDTALPGFRKGKAPLEVIKKRFKNKIDEEVLSNLIPKAYAQAVDITKIAPYAAPEIKIKSFNENSLKFHADVQLKPEVVIGQYKSLSFHKDGYKISPKDIDVELKKLQDRYADFILKENKKIEDNDIVLLKIDAFDENQNIIKDLSDDNHKIEIKKENLFDEFYKNLIGLSSNDEKEFTREYPEDFNNAQISGKKVIYKLKVKEVREKKLPQLDDEFAKDVGDYKSIDELKEAIERQLKDIMDNHIERRLERSIMDRNIGNSKFEIPQKLIKDRANSLLNEFKQNLSRQGQDFEAMIEKKVISLDKIQEEIRQQAVKDLKEYLIIMKMAELEKIEVTDTEIDDLIKKEAEARKQNPGEYKKGINEDVKLYLKQSILTRKIMDFFRENNKIKKGKIYKAEDILKEAERRV